jgi:hypothetical protein
MLINAPYSAPKSATKRVFLITDNDDPFAGSHNPRLITSARTTLIVCEKFLHATRAEGVTFSGSLAGWCERRAFLHQHGR